MSKDFKLTIDDNPFGAKEMKAEEYGYPDALDHYSCETCDRQVWKKVTDDDKRCAGCIELKRSTSMMKQYNHQTNMTYLFYYTEDYERKIVFQTKGDLTNKNIKINLEKKDVKEVRQDCFYCGQGVYDDTFKVTEKGLEYPAHKECILTAEKPKSSLDIYIPSKEEWKIIGSIGALLFILIAVFTFPTWFYGLQDWMQILWHHAKANRLLLFQILTIIGILGTILGIRLLTKEMAYYSKPEKFDWMMGSILGCVGFFVYWVIIGVIIILWYPLMNMRFVW